MHPLLTQHLQLAFGDVTPPPVAPLLPLVDAAYRAADRDRMAVQRSLDGLSAELHERYEEMERQLNERERHVRILQAVHDAVMLFDASGHVLEVNDAALRISGRTREWLLGREVGEMLRVAGDGEAPDLNAIGSQEAGALDVLFQRDDGTARLCELTVIPFGEPASAPGTSIAVVRDVTERRSLQNQVFQSHKLEAIGQLAAGVAHEINTPAQYVSDNLRFLGESFGTILKALPAGGTADGGEELEFLGQEVPTAIEQSLSGMERISEIVRGIKTFAHPGTGSRSPCNLNEILQTTVTVARNEWKYVADVEFDLDPALPSVSAYTDELQHVFLNLVVNAAQAIGAAAPQGAAKGHIRITTRAHADHVEIRVQDDGPGVPGTIQGRIFDPFFTTKPAGTGTGQGLAICHRVVEHHGGRIELDRGATPGATFVVRLPIAPALDAAA